MVLKAQHGRVMVKRAPEAVLMEEHKDEVATVVEIARFRPEELRREGLPQFKCQYKIPRAGCSSGSCRRTQIVRQIAA